MPTVAPTFSCSGSTGSELRCGDDLLRKADEAVAAAVEGNQHGEFVAAEPGDAMPPAGGAREAVGDRAEHGVAGGVAVDVVDRLEPVEIDEEHGN